ncbi:MAG: hypothetical protein H7Y38_01745 [Armatimonadetes bacterium]|nr:hypothetical protein [Armatimonadota bacterium]
MPQLACLLARAAHRFAAHVVCAAFSLFLVALPASASVTLTFDTITGMSNAPTATVPVESRLSNQFATSGVVFRSGSGATYVAVVDLSGTGTTSLPNGIGGATLADTLTYTGSPLIIANFVDPANAVTPFVTDFVSVRADTIPSGGTIGLQAFDVFGALIGSVSETDTGGNTLIINTPGINRVEILGSTNADVAYDDFTFNDVTPLVAVVPEAGTFALLGFALVPVGVGLVRSPHWGGAPEVE